MTACNMFGPNGQFYLVHRHANRVGRYGLAKLIDKRGRDGKLVDWLDELTADCPKKKSLLNMSDRYGAKCPQLPKVL